MRPIHLFVVGLLFLTAALLGLGLLFFRILPARASSADNVSAEDLQPPSSSLPATATATPAGLLPGSVIRHRVADGEWLNQIVRCYGANYQEVLSANPNLVDPAQLLPATVLTIPHIGSSGRIYGPPCITFHIVQSGDTWSSVAQRYNADSTVLEAVNCLLEVGATLKIPLNSAGGPNNPILLDSTGTPGSPIPPDPTEHNPRNSAGTPGNPVPPDPTERIPLFSISANSPSVNYSGIVPPLGKVCVDLDASEVQTLNIQVNADEDSALTVQKPDGVVIPRTDTNLSLSESNPQTGKYRVVIASSSRDAIIRYTLEAKIKASPSATKTITPGALSTGTPTQATSTLTPVIPTVDTPIRVNLPAGQTTVLLAGVISSDQAIHYLLAAAQGQTLSLGLTAPANQLYIGVTGPTGAVLKAMDATPAWSATIAANGDYRISIAAMPGSSSQSFTLQVTLRTAATGTEETATGTALPTPSTSVPEPEPPLLIEAEWPKRLEVGRSDTIRISLIRVSDKAYVPSVEVAGHTASVSTAINIGTPGVSAAEAMGPDYEAFAIAYLAAPAFHVSLASSELQPLDQPRLDWTWNILSDQANPQVIAVTIEVQWKAKDGSGLPIQRVLWRSSPPLDIEVYRPLVTTGQLSLFTLLSGSIGSGLSIPFLYGVMKERSKKTPPKRKSRGG